MRNRKVNGGAQERTLSWPGNTEGVAAEDIDFEALAHVLANTCLWGGRTTRYHSLAARAVIVSEEVEALDGIVPEERRSLALHALLADAPAAWFGGLDPASKKAAERMSKLTRKIGRTVREAAGLAPEMDEGNAELVRLMARMAEAAERRDLAGIPAEAGAAFPPLRRRIKPVDPDKAAKLWLDRFRALSSPAAAPGSGTGMVERP